MKFAGRSNRIVLSVQKGITLFLMFVLFFMDAQQLVLMMTGLKFSALPTVEKAQATTGDIAVFREAGGTQTIPSDGTPYDVEWDTTVKSSSNITLQGNSSDIDLADGGKYLVIYNVWAEQGTSTAGTNRRSVETYLTLNGTEQAYGRAAGYVRDNENDLTAYPAGAAIIDATAGHDLQVHIARTDANTGAGTNIPSNKNGVSVIKLNDDWDYLRAQRTSNSADISSNTSFTDVTWTTSDETDTGSFSFTPTSGDITLKGNAGDHFLVTANVRLEQNAASSNRLNYEMRATIDGVEVPGSRTTSYVRGNPNSNGTYTGTLVYSGIVRKQTSADETFSLEVRRESTTAVSTIIVGGETAIAIAKLPETAYYATLTSTSTNQTLTSAVNSFTWNDRSELETAAYSHSTSTNNSRLNIDLTGDYLLLSTTYNQRTSGTGRDAAQIEWRFDGSSLQTYGGHGSFNRGAQGGVDAFTGGSTGGGVFSLTDTQYVELVYSDETNGTPNSTFNPGLITLQAVELSSLFQTDVEVSSVGAQASSVDISTTNAYLGGTFVVTENSSSRNITDITLTESGSIDGSTSLENIKIYYDLDTTNPYDCASESYSGGESQFGSTDANGFSGPDGVSSFTGSVGIGTTQAFCGYVFYDINATSSDGDTINIAIANPSTDVSVTSGGSVGPGTSVGPTGSTTARSAELTQVHYRWLNDDGIEGAATTVEAEDTAATGFANGIINRLRTQISAEGSTSSLPTTLRLEYATSTGVCSASTDWTDVGASNGAWDMSDTAFFVTDGLNSSDLTPANGGTTNENTTHIAVNGALKDTSSTLASALTFTSANFLELEFSIEPTVHAVEGSTYCFRITDQGTPLRNYDVYPEATVSADITVSATGTHATSLDTGSVNQYLGGGFVIQRSGGTRTVTDITITERGLVDAQNDLSNIGLWYDMDTSAPYDCTGESFDGDETQFGATSTSFSAADGTITFSGSQNVNNTQTMCPYVILSVDDTATNGETILVEIANASVDVVVTGSSVGPSSPLAPTASTTINGPVITQTGYHWRNDDGSESSATSASGGSENTAIIDIPKESPRRLRLQIDNAGSVSSVARQYRLEYGTKVSTCDLVGTWNDIGVAGGAFDLVNTANLTDGNDTTDVSGGANGEITNPGGATFLTPNGGQKDTSSQTGNITLTSSQFVELEYALQATDEAGDETTYCFRLTDAGTALPAYTQYAEFTTREKRDFFTQRGVATTTGTSVTLTAGVDYVAPASTSSAFVRITNTQMTGAGRDTSGTTQLPDDVTAYITSADDLTSSFTISRPSGAANNTVVHWEIIEFIGLPGTDNEIIVRDVDTVSYGLTSTFATGTSVSGVTDNSDVVVFITGQTNESGIAQEYYNGLSTAAWSPTSSAPVFQRATAVANDAASLSYAVVEFVGVNWKIQRVEHTYSAAGTTETENITAVTSVNSTFVHTQKRVPDVTSGTPNSLGLDEMGHEVWLSSVGAVSFALHSGADAPGSHVSVAWVIENTQTGDGAMVVSRSNGTLGTGASNGCGGTQPCAVNIGIGNTIGAVSNASIFMTSHSNGSGTAYPRAINAVRLVSTTEYEVWRSETGQAQTYRTAVVEWPVAEISFRQNYYRLYVDNDTLTPTDPWPVGAADLGENESITGADDPLGEGEVVRIRMTVRINNASLPASTKSFKLQFGKRDTTCSAISVWTDLGSPGSGAIWRGYDGTPADGTEVASTSLLISLSDRSGTYEESNNSAVNPWYADIGEDIEYDWVVQQNGAVQRTDYCFRMVNSDDSLLTSYNQYPTIRTTGYTPVVGDWRWYGDETNETPTSPLASENVAPADVTNEDAIKLRVQATEVEGASGVNVKFRLQYSEKADFSDGGTFVETAAACTATSTWCYENGAGTDNQIISTSTLTTTDSCVLGVGNGCGNHNEAPTTTTSLTQTAGSNMEFEFTLKPAGPRVNTVYFFRLYDVPNDEGLVASTSFPSLVTEGGSLVFTVEGVNSGTATEGVTTDVTTTPISVPFGSVPFNTDYEAAYRLTVDVNATEGYQMFMYANQDLLDSYGNRIDPITGTNATPVAWGTGCSGATSGCIGYHVGDDALAGNSTRFSPNDTYAAISTTTPEEVMYSGQPTTNESSDLIFKIRVTEEQPAGLYENEVVFISVPIF